MILNTLVPDSIIGSWYVYCVDETEKTAILYINNCIMPDAKWDTVTHHIEHLESDWKLRILLNTPGGCMGTTFALLRAVQMTKAEVITHNAGMAASCGSWILGMGSKIIIEPNSNTMYHNSSGGYGGYTSTIGVYGAVQQQVIVKFVFDNAVRKGLLTREESNNIIKKNQEFYLSSKVITERLSESGFLLEED